MFRGNSRRARVAPIPGGAPMTYTFENYMDACDKAHGAVEYLCEQFRQEQTRSNIEARHLLIKAQEAAVDEAERIMLTRPIGSRKE